MATIKQTIDRPISKDLKGVRAVINEANDGIQAVPSELVIKASDDSTFTQISDARPMPVRTSGSVFQEQLTEADAVAGVLTFSENVAAIELYNTDATNAGVFTVNGLTINVPATKVFNSIIGGTPSATVTVTGSTSYIVSRYA